MTTATATTPDLHDGEDRLLEVMFGVVEDGACWACGEPIPGDPDRCFCDACASGVQVRTEDEIAAATGRGIVSVTVGFLAVLAAVIGLAVAVGPKP